jgi:hypothetical protein
MTPESDERYALHFRWGAFRLSVIGRGVMLAWALTIASLLGVKLLWPVWQSGLSP